MCSRDTKVAFLRDFYLLRDVPKGQTYTIREETKVSGDALIPGHKRHEASFRADRGAGDPRRAKS